MTNRLLFVHDGPIYVDRSNNLYYSVHYNDSLIERYQQICTNVSFLMRTKDVNKNELNSYTLITKSNFNLIEIPNYKSLFSLYKKIKARQIIKFAVSHCDIVIVRLPSSAALIALEYAKKLKKPYFVEVVACVYDALWNYDWRGKLISRFKMYQYRSAIKNSTHVLYVTNQFLQNRYPTSGKSIGCSDVFIPALDSVVLENRLRRIGSMLDTKCITLATVSAIDVSYKGHEDVIKAVSILNRNGYNLKYKIVGQGSPLRLLQYIKNYNVTECVDILGPIPHDHILEFLDSIDVYIQPSKTEGLPRAVIEAMSRACPTMGSSAGGIPELIDKDFVFSPGEVDDICYVIKTLTIKKLQESAELNFYNSIKYTVKNLDSIRNEFYNQFCIDFGFGVAK